MTKSLDSKLKSAIDAFESKKEAEASGGTPLYRPRGWRRCERRREREEKKKDWFKKGNKAVRYLSSVSCHFIVESMRYQSPFVG